MMNKYLFETCSGYYLSFIYSPTDALVSCLKKTILKFTLEFLREFASASVGEKMKPIMSRGTVRM